jgi:energy-coupling factor transporter ATP-binding protein EcfA2
MTKPKSILEIIHDWSVSRPLWLRDALRRIVIGGAPTEGDIDELVELCKAGHGITKAVAQPLEATHVRSAPVGLGRMALTAIKDVSGVNQLAANQTLEFGTQGLTIIYGQNGSGKSGYTRILKRACNARHRGAIMPDAFTAPSGLPASATLLVDQSGTEVPISWVDDEAPSSELAAITVFDRDCASLHLNQKNPVLFRPFGLDIPDDLATTCVAVKEHLEADLRHCQERRDTDFATPYWSSQSPLGQILGALTAESDISPLETATPLTPQEAARLAQLKVDLAADPARVASEYGSRAAQIDRLRLSLASLASQLSDGRLTALESAASGARQARLAADAAAKATFGGLALQGIGSEEWRVMWDSARRYMASQVPPDQPFPPSAEAPCPLCHQPVSPTAADRLDSFEAFIRADTEALAERAEIDLAESKRAIENIQIDIHVHAPALTLVADRDPSSARKAQRFLAGLRLRRRKALQRILNPDLEIVGLAPDPGADLERVAAEIKSYAEALEASVDAEARAELTTEYYTLRDRELAPRLAALAKAEVARLQEEHALTSCIAECATNAITKLGNDIADQKITPVMRDRFQSEIVKLAADRVRVEIVRSGGKSGSPQYEIRFFANAKAKVANVLSEGEQTCVALAAHLTELAQESPASALVFDDPVTSLDHRWRRKVAERLVEEAAARQVIVFTHDLVFVNDLDELAMKAGVPCKPGTLSRTADGTGVYSADLPWRAAKVRQRVDELEKEARAAKLLYDAGDEEKYREAAVRIYDKLRAAWERGLEDCVFAGVIMRHRDYINTKDLKRVAALDLSDVTSFEQNFKKCCDLIEAHDPSRGRDGNVPPPADVWTDISALKSWEEGLRQKQNALAKS